MYWAERSYHNAMKHLVAGGAFETKLQVMSEGCCWMWAAKLDHSVARWSPDKEMKLSSAPTRNISSQTLAWSHQEYSTLRTCQSNIHRGFISIISNQQLPNQNYIQLCQEAFKEFFFFFAHKHKGLQLPKTICLQLWEKNNSALLQTQLDAEQNWSRPVFKNGYSKMLQPLLFYCTFSLWKEIRKNTLEFQKPTVSNHVFIQSLV